MSRLQFIVSDSLDPFLNIAVENYLVSHAETDNVVLYLWRNRRTVVIGQNQNPYSECNVELLEAEGGHLMRRCTGGGAVYHDDGNLNFSFVAPESLYSQPLQFSTLVGAVQSYGLRCELSGRNDVLCEGRKFSGNAFSRGVKGWLHHGTILIGGNMEDMHRYLLPKPNKLRKHGVKSMRSRVVNLSELADVTVENIIPRLLSSFQNVYGADVEELRFSQLVATDEVQLLRSHFADDSFRFGRWKSFEAHRKANFDWGEVEMQLSVSESDNTITSVCIATDALRLDLIESIKVMLTGASMDVRPALDATLANEDRCVLNDMLSMVYIDADNCNNV